MQHLSRLPVRFTITPMFRFSTNYYQILGVPKSATNDQLLEAYTEKAKEYFPEVQTGTQNPLNAEQGKKFQQLAEAYAVLSVPESRYNYDTMNKEQSELVFAQAREAFQTLQQKNEDGSKAKPGYKAGSWAEQRKRWLAEERTRFNVDHIGRYQGGLPQKDRMNIRGSALGIPNQYHDPLIHNYKINPMENEQRVDPVMKQAFQVWAQREKAGKTRQYLYQLAEVDYNFWRFEHVRTGWRWFRNLFLAIVAFPFLLVAYCKFQNRRLIEELYHLHKVGQKIEGAMVRDGKYVHLGANGALVLRQKTNGGHH